MTDTPVVETAAPVNEAQKSDGPRSTVPGDIEQAKPEADAGKGSEVEEEEESEAEVESESEKEEDKPKPKKKKNLQTRFSEITAERYALQSERDQLRAELESARKGQPAPVAAKPVSTADDPVFDENGVPITIENCDFDSVLMARKLAKAEARNMLESERKAAKRQEVEKAWNDRLATFSVDRPDFQDKAFKNPLAEFYPGDMRDYIVESEIGPQLAYHLGQNLNVTDALIRMAPRERDRALARIEAKLEEKPAAATPRTFTQAPAPVKSLSGSGQVEKSPDDMTMPEFIAWRKRNSSAKR
jgi:hypothetical protein